jgi:hypothetical protein
VSGGRCPYCYGLQNSAGACGTMNYPGASYAGLATMSPPLTDSQRIAALEARVAALEAQPTASTEARASASADVRDRPAVAAAPSRVAILDEMESRHDALGGTASRMGMGSVLFQIEDHLLREPSDAEVEAFHDAVASVRYGRVAIRAALAGFLANRRPS